MTRKSRREIERAIEGIEDADADPDSRGGVTADFIEFTGSGGVE